MPRELCWKNREQKQKCKTLSRRFELKTEGVLRDIKSSLTSPSDNLVILSWNFFFMQKMKLYDIICSSASGMAVVNAKSY